MNPIADTFTKIMAGYRRAYEGGRFSGAHPICKAFEELSLLIEETAPVLAHRPFRIKWSVGQGRWALVPWFAILDTNRTTRVSAGVYVVFLFREDMSGVYLTLNQGTGNYAGGYLHELNERTEKLRARYAGLAEHHFEVGAGVSLHSGGRLAEGYERAVIAHRFYDRERMPSDKTIVSDLGAVLAAYRELG